MLSQILKREVEDYFHRVKESSPLVVNARLGKLSRNEIGNYLANIHYLISYTPIHLSLATERAKKMGRPELAEFFTKRMHEEVGHEKWAENDLKRVSGQLEFQGTSPISRNMRELVSYLTQRISEDPRLYMAYILFTEYFTVLIGPTWLHDLETQCGIPKSFLSVVDNHAELDKDHVQDDLREIDALCGQDEAEPYLDLMRTAGELLDLFTIEVGTVK